MKTRHVLAAAAVLAALFSGAAHATWLRVLVSQPLDGSSMGAREQRSSGGPWDTAYREDFATYSPDVLDASPTGITIVLHILDGYQVISGSYDFYQPAGGAPVDRMTVSRTEREVTIEFLAGAPGSPLTPMTGARSLILGDPNGDWGEFSESINVVTPDDGQLTLLVGFQRVPEPGTALLLCGVGLAMSGATLRHRRRHRTLEV